MENRTQENKQQKEEILLQDVHNDEYWAKKYDVSPDDLKKSGINKIADIIIKAGIKHKSFQTA